MPCLLLAAVCLVLVTFVVARTAVHQKRDPEHWDRVRRGGQRVPGAASGSTGALPPPPPGGGTVRAPERRGLEAEAELYLGEVSPPPEWPPQSGLNDAPTDRSELLDGDRSWR